MDSMLAAISVPGSLRDFSEFQPSDPGMTALYSSAQDQLFGTLRLSRVYRILRSRKSRSEAEQVPSVCLLGRPGTSARSGAGDSSEGSWTWFGEELDYKGLVVMCTPKLETAVERRRE